MSIDGKHYTRIFIFPTLLTHDHGLVVVLMRHEEKKSRSQCGAYTKPVGLKESYFIEKR